MRYAEVIVGGGIGKRDMEYLPGVVLECHGHDDWRTHFRRCVAGPAILKRYFHQERRILRIKRDKLQVAYHRHDVLLVRVQHQETVCGAANFYRVRDISP